MGRWVSQDPLGFDAGDSNLYRYVNNWATVAIDPSGLDQEQEFWVRYQRGKDNKEHKNFQTAEILVDLKVKYNFDKNTVNVTMGYKATAKSKGHDWSNVIYGNGIVKIRAIRPGEDPIFTLKNSRGDRFRNPNNLEPISSNWETMSKNGFTSRKVEGASLTASVEYKPFSFGPNDDDVKVLSGQALISYAAGDTFPQTVGAIAWSVAVVKSRGAIVLRNLHYEEFSPGDFKPPGGKNAWRTGREILKLDKRQGVPNGTGGLNIELPRIEYGPGPAYPKIQSRDFKDDDWYMP